MQTLRTPDDRFAALTGFDHEPQVRRGARRRRAARCGWRTSTPGPADAPVVLLLHGEPTWSYLYRHVIDALSEAGLRSVAVDLVGFGRSDKPTRAEDHSFAAHVEWVRSLVLDVLDLQDVTLVGQDWGGLIGLRLVAEHPDRFARVVAANTGLPTGDFDMPEIWWQFRARGRDAPRSSTSAGSSRRGASAGSPTTDRAAYDAPFPDESFKAGPRAMPTPGADPARRPGDAGQPGGLGGARPVGQAVPRRVQRQRPDHRRDGTGPGEADPGRRAAWSTP